MGGPLSSADVLTTTGVGSHDPVDQPSAMSQGETLPAGGEAARALVAVEVLEVGPKRPDHFTVVYRTVSEHSAVSGTRRDLGRAYTVCPNSGSRVRLRGHPDELDCPECGHHGVIAWWETG